MEQLKLSDIIDILIEFSLKIKNKKEAIQFIRKDQKKHLKINKLLIKKFNISKQEIKENIQKENENEEIKQNIPKTTKQEEIKNNQNNKNEIEKTLLIENQFENQALIFESKITKIIINVEIFPKFTEIEKLE